MDKHCAFCREVIDWDDGTYCSPECQEAYEARDREFHVRVRRRGVERQRQAVLREVRDALVYCRDGFDEKLEVDERLVFDHHILRWFRKGGRFEVEEE